MVDGSREQATDVLHDEELGSKDLDPSKELPEEHPPGVLDRLSTPSGAECLARRATDQDVEIFGRETQALHHLMRVVILDRTPQNLCRRAPEKSRISVCHKGVAEL